MRQYPSLDQINCPADVRKLPVAELPELCADIREFLIDHVSRTGGHLASNLGAVELTVAIHRLFHAPEDNIIFDVGHQCYVHKILTGRKDRFDTLRKFGGLSGFLRPSESPYDSLVSGHASNSVSAALGMARADVLLNRQSQTVCVIGDGALTGGMVYEALNDAGQSGLPLIIVFNDNHMSIEQNVGAVAKRLAAIRIKPRYFRLKERTKAGLSRFPGGERIIRGISSVKRRIRTAILKETLFELMGFRYLGPADGNDLNAVCTLLEQAKKLNQPVVVHLKTVKGKGYLPSEQSPSDFHGVSAFDSVTGQLTAGSGGCFSDVFGDTLCELAKENPTVCAITAAMTSGTGLSVFASQYPSRFFDVGIAEEHAVTMASGLAERGMTPVCAIYSTFLQRGYDQLLHDVAINKNHVVLAIDRAGVVGADGETHQGIFDVPYLRTVPGLTLLSPASYAELRTALRQAAAMDTPVAVRYPRGPQGDWTGDSFSASACVLRQGTQVTLCTYGILINVALRAAGLLEKQGISAAVLKINNLSDYDKQLVQNCVMQTRRLIVLEDCVEHGCFGQQLLSDLAQNGGMVQAKLLNMKENFLPHGSVEQLYHAYFTDDTAVVAAAEELLYEG